MSSTYFYNVIKVIKIFLYPTSTLHIICGSFGVRREFEVLLRDGQGTAASPGRKCLTAINMVSPALSVFLNCINKDQC